jgi:adenylate cyclase
MRLLRVISYGTKGYPENVARRLRAMNIAAWITAALMASFAIRRLIDPPDDKLRPGLVSAAAALCFAALPLLHRFSPLAAPLVFVGFAYAFIFWVVSRGGTGGGAWLGYVVAVPLAVLLFGVESFALTAILSAVAAALIIIVHLILPTDTGYLSPQSLFYGNFVTNVVVTTALLFAVVHYAIRQIARAEATAEREYQRSESLLQNILPAQIAERLKARKEPVIADKYEEASILFADIAGFTERASETTPEELVRFLNGAYTEFDRLVEGRGLEKIKTTGDSYMVVSGVPAARPDHAQALADFALAMRASVAELRDPHGRNVSIRIGIACGSVVAGVVGTRKIFYDVWGDAVNVASRMESTGEPGRIQVSADAYDRLKDEFVLELRGPVEIKGKGQMVTWYLIKRRLPEEF